MTKPLVSVIVPAFNAQATLAQTLSSAAAQSHDGLEILIVDDGSTDSTRDIAAAFCAGEPRARLIVKENGGVASARNRGIAEARGEWLAPLDSDDLWHPTRIAAMLAAAQAAPKPPGFVCCWFRVIDENSMVIGSRGPWRAEGRGSIPLLYRNYVGNGSGLLMRREAALAAGGYDESLRARGAEGCEDLALQLRIAAAHHVVCVPEYLVGYRHAPDAMSRNAERMARSWALAVSEAPPTDNRAARRALDWAEAMRSLGRAEGCAARGKPVEAARLLARAIALDPRRTGLNLAYRTARMLARLVRGRRPPAPPRSFADCGPDERIRTDPDEISRLVLALERFEARRMARLARQSR